MIYLRACSERDVWFCNKNPSVFVIKHQNNRRDYIILDEKIETAYDMFISCFLVIFISFSE
jgi:hypothetical protein